LHERERQQLLNEIDALGARLHDANAELTKLRRDGGGN
jgi:hypothetical protein